MRIGNYTLRRIETGRFALDGGAMFGVVPRALWEKTNPPDERNRIPMASRSLLLEGNDRRILIDTGNGDKRDAKFQSIFKIDQSESDLRRSLRRAGIEPDTVTDVVLTHLHFDHAGGATVRREGEVVPTFPQATYYVQREHWEAAHAPTERDRASFLPEDFDPLLEHGILRFTEGNGEIFPGVRVETVHGHTSALQCPVVTDGETTLFYCADLVPLAAHVALPWIMGYDLRPLVTLEEKRRLISRAEEERWILYLQHDPDVAAGRVMKDEKGYRLGERVDVDS